MEDEDAIVIGGLALLVLASKKPAEVKQQPSVSEEAIPQQIVPQPPLPLPQPQPPAPQPAVAIPHPGFAPCCPNTANKPPK